MRKRSIIMSILCLLLALPSGALAEGNQAQTPQSVKVERGTSKTVSSEANAAFVEDYFGPVLESATVSPTSAEVGDIITITAQVSDDVSGVAEVNAYLNLPDGIGYKILPLVFEEGEWMGTYTIKEFDQEGTWIIDFDLYDAAGNYSFGAATDTLQVTNPNGDTEFPTLAGASVNPLSVGANEPVTITAKVNDNTAVDSVYAYVYTADSTGNYYLPLTFDASKGEWSVSHTFNESDRSGKWFIDIEMFDVAGNFDWVTLQEELQLTNPFSDYTNPTIGEPAISPASASPGDTVQVRVPVTDDKSGVSSVYAEFAHVDSPGYVYSAKGVLDEATKEWVIDFIIEPSFYSGVWNVVIYAADQAGNSGFKEIFGAFEVINDNGDFDAPIISNIQVTPQGDVQLGDRVTITADVSDNVGLDEVYATAYGQDGYEYVPMSNDAGNDQWSGQFEVQSTTTPGFYTVTVSAYDTSSNYHSEDAEGGFTVINTEGDFTGPVISAVELDKAEVNAGEQVTIIATVEDVESGVAYVLANYALNESIILKYDNSLGKYVGTITVPTNIPDGAVININYVDAVDKKGNISDPFWYPGSFLVHNTDGDYTAPVVESLEVTSSTAKVGEKVQIKAKVTDDKTGVKRVMLSLTNGGLGFKDVELVFDQNSGLWVGSYTVKANDHPGKYAVIVSTEDNNGNSQDSYPEQTLTIDNPNADVTGPVVKTVEITPADAKVGDTVKIVADVSDDNSSVYGVYASFESPNYEKYESISLVLNPETKKWEGTYEVKEFDLPGSWHVNVTAFDDAGNSGSIEEESQFVIDNPDGGDGATPTVDSFVMTPTTAKPGDTVHFEAKLADDKSGVKSASIYLYGNSSASVYPINMTFDEGNQVWTADYVIPAYAGLGFHSVSVDIEDHAGNLEFYYAAQSLLILNDNPDHQAPVFESITLSPEEASAGDEVTFKVNFADNHSGVKNASLVLFNPDSADSYNADDERAYRFIDLVYNEQEKLWIGTYTVTAADPIGAWTLSYDVEDNAGNWDQKTISEKLQVVKAPIELPMAVNEVTDKDTTVTGQTQANAKVEVKGNGTVLGGATAGADGAFTVTIPVQKAGTEIEVTATDDAGNVSAAVKVVVKDATAPEQPTVNEVTDKDTSVTGKAEAGSKIEVKGNGTLLGSATAGADGAFTVTIPVQKAGTEIEVTATDEAGNVSEAVKVIVKDVTAPEQPTVNEVTDKETSVTGKAEAGSKVEVKGNGNVLGSATAGADGAFTVTIPVQKAGTELEVTATDQAGNISVAAKVVVKDATASDQPAVNEVTDKDTSVTGKAEAGSNVEVKGNGTVLGSATAGADGAFTVTIPVQKAGTELEVTATDEAGNVSAAVKVVVKDVTPPAKPTVNEVTDKATSVTGQAEAVSKVEVKVNGAAIGIGTAGEDGKFTVTIPVQKGGVNLVITAADAAGNVSEGTTLTVKATATEKPTLVPLIGDTRYETAVKVSQTGWNTAESVLLVNGFAIVDGLTSTPLATAKNAPILLTATDSIPQSTLDEITRLNAKEIVLIGGEGVISSKVEKTLRTKGYTVTRIGGSTRKDTSLLIAKELNKLVDVNTIYVAYGWGEPDALSIAAQAGMTKQPIILVEKTTIPDATLTWLKNEKLPNAYVIGGEEIVAPSILNQVDEVTSADIRNNRLSGLTRHETNAKVISKFYSDAELSSILVTKSETENLVDALTAGPLAAKLGSPVLLISTTVGLFPEQQQVLAGKHFKQVYQVGGGVNPTSLNEVLK
ncbi:Ig-like domain-containing protein [Neobacillus sp. YX16]|uniref:Ig-like domain-containing protein n=1 Tax=Neobacillus sp. YX16 TaxID=3047874 RepID=UPI0024C2381B|nr:Ig-like domain-containing protein [Neobacillus sp. YX16]WHZ02863.1 Ig-like domain-containing protein [Neobacillus sp. YX16]